MTKPLRDIMLPAVGARPVLQWVAPADLRIDPGYQRSIDNSTSQRLIRSIAINWDWTLCQPLVVAMRAASAEDPGGLYVVDGQHRQQAALERGDIDQLPCFISAYRGGDDEAQAFVRFNTRRKPLNPLEVFKAALRGGDAEAATIARLVEGNGLKICSHFNLALAPPDQVNNIGGIRKALRTHGEGVVDAALDLLAQSFKGQKLVYAGTLWPGIVAIAAQELARDKGFTDGDRFILATEMLGGTTQQDWYQDIVRASDAHAPQALASRSAKVLLAAWAETLEAAEDD
jgi:hypothetical protein